MILVCTCKHAVQDSLYGVGRRVHNLCKKGAYVRCTVCKKEKPSGSSAKEVVKEKKHE